MPVIESKPFDTEKASSFERMREAIRSFTGVPAGTRDLRIGAKTINVFPGQDIQNAIDTLNQDGGGIVFLKTGTHYPTSNLLLYSNISLIGEGRGLTVIDFAGAAYGIACAAALKTNLLLRDFTVQNSNAAAGIFIERANYFRIENVYATSCDQDGIGIDSCYNFFIGDVLSTNNTSDGISITGDATYTTSLFQIRNCVCSGNSGCGYQFTATGGVTIYRFSVVGCVGTSNAGDNFQMVAASATTVFYGSFVGCDASNSSAGDGYDYNGASIQFIGCSASSNLGYGFNITGTFNTLTGCYAAGNTAGEYNLAFGNNLIASQILNATGDPSASLFLNEKNTALGNWGTNIQQVRTAVFFYNNSGGNLSRGQVVVFDAANGIDRVTTTTTAGDNLVAGVVAEVVFTSATWGVVLLEGFTAYLKVDGTTDIAVGDFLKTSTTAGVAVKASAGDTVFAIALEAYATDDANGVIDALIIRPRKI